MDLPHLKDPRGISAHNGRGSVEALGLNVSMGEVQWRRLL